MAEPSGKTFALPAGHPIFAGHFPGRPIVPGAMLLEWVLEEVARQRGCAPATLRVREAKFFAPLPPACRADLQLEFATGRCAFVVQHGEVSVARGVLEWNEGA
jgi:3-hydroxymyristoyl/3-hydroxydecanoyl-(acyl carrier protein) dehydratase